MRIIHCADIHLDSNMGANLNSEKAAERNVEILNTFISMFDYAQNYEVDAILIAGDLFDTDYSDRAIVNSVINVIRRHENIAVYYINGNHDRKSLQSEEMLPSNLHMFRETWTAYDANKEGSIKIYGINLSKMNNLSFSDTLRLDEKNFNIVMLHGADVEYTPQVQDELISLRELRNRGIDYLAMGHIHKGKTTKLDDRGILVYPGCLEGRGYDECGEKGFVVLDIDEEDFEKQIVFVPFAKRRIYEVTVDVSQCLSTAEIKEACEEELERLEITDDSLVKIILTGKLGEVEKDTELLRKMLENYFYSIKIKDETEKIIKFADYEKSSSITGEFIRLVKASELTEEDKMRVAEIGLLALKGGKL